MYKKKRLRERNNILNKIKRGKERERGRERETQGERESNRKRYS